MRNTTVDVASGRVFVLGYGNPGRQDDGLGPAVAEGVGALGLPDVTADADYQLNIEYGAIIADYDTVLFVDASTVAPDPFELKPIKAAASLTFTSHSVSPELVLAICEAHFGACPEAWLLGVRGHAFEFEEGLSKQAETNRDAAVSFVRSLITSWRERNYGNEPEDDTRH